MRIKVLFFGFTRDLTGFERENLDVSKGETLETLWDRYQSRFPKLAAARESLLIAINEQVAERSWELQEGDEVAFLPPVSGGSSEAENQEGKNQPFRITREAIRTRELTEQMKSPEDGAVVLFEGIVRNNLDGRRTLFLEYEGYEPMAVRKMEEIGREAHEKIGIDRIAIVHRLGRVEIGETSVAIVVTAAHREKAFEACHYAIDRLKQIVPIWKKEYFEDGSIWAKGEQKRIVNQKSEVTIDNG